MEQVIRVFVNLSDLQPATNSLENGRERGKLDS
jgi:hypothetical protein